MKSENNIQDSTDEENNQQNKLFEVVGWIFWILLGALACYILVLYVINWLIDNGYLGFAFG